MEKKDIAKSMLSCVEVLFEKNIINKEARDELERQVNEYDPTAYKEIQNLLGNLEKLSIAC